MFIVVAGHFDGVNKMSQAQLPTWLAAAEKHVESMKAAGYRDTWELTAGEIGIIERARPGWLKQTVAGGGVVVVPREPHTGDLGGDAYAAAAAMAAAGLPTSKFLGSVLDPARYAGGPWLLFGVGAVPGHTGDSEMSGIGEISPGLNGFYGGTGNSVAIKRKVASMVASGELPAAYELVRYNGADPKTGSEPWFASPARHGTQAPVPILTDISRVMADIVKDGNGDIVSFVSYGEALAAWSASPTAPYIVPKTVK